jgi:hypothetical protein
MAGAGRNFPPPDALLKAGHDRMEAEHGPGLARKIGQAGHRRQRVGHALARTVGGPNYSVPEIRRKRPQFADTEEIHREPVRSLEPYLGLERLHFRRRLRHHDPARATESDRCRQPFRQLLPFFDRRDEQR